jgi:trigger factor
LRERTRPEAINNLQTIVILREIAKKESLEPELEAVEKKIKEVTRELGDRNIDHQRLRKMVQDDLLTEKTLDWLQSQAKVELLPKGSLPEKKSEEETEEKGE